MKEPRILRGWPLLGSIPDLLRQPAEFCSSVNREYPGEIVRVRAGTSSFLLVTDPDHMEHIFVRNDENYWKGHIFNSLRPIFGSGLLLSEGEEWRHYRRILQPAFNLQALRLTVPSMREAVREVTAGWRDGQIVDVERDMRRITMRIILRQFFSDSIAPAAVQSIEAAFERVLRRAPLAFFSWFVPGSSRAILGSPAKELDHHIYELIAQRKKSPQPHADLLAALLQAADTSGRPLPPQVIRDHISTTVFAGYEASSTALHWMWILLSLHPEVRDRAYAEIRKEGGDLEQLRYCRNVISEALRMFAPFWESFRTAHADDEVCGYRVRRGESLLISPHAAHRDPRFWSRPDVFDPDRFDRGEPRHRHAFLPFLFGPRTCIGKHMAMLEMLAVIQEVGRHWRLELSNTSWVPVSTSHGSTRPRGAPSIRALRLAAGAYEGIVDPMGHGTATRRSLDALPRQANP